jgi:hypothetical protein
VWQRRAWPRIKNILLTPKIERPKIAAEPTSITTVLTSYVVPLAGVAEIGRQVAQQEVTNDSSRPAVAVDAMDYQVLKSLLP